MDVRIVFMGTPEFAVPTLIELARNFQVLGVITQPDRPTGRGRKLKSSAVKLQAGKLNLHIFQPPNTNSKESITKIKDWKPDLICVAAYGQILSPELLHIPEFGCLNVHASLLPRWRGASPINAAIDAGDIISGVTIMKMAEGLDDGPILNQESVEISDHETAGSLSERLSILGANLLAKTIPPFLEGKIQPQNQDSELATYAGMLKKGDGLLNFNQPAERIVRRIRAYHPWPGTYTFWNEKRMIIHKAIHKSVTSPGEGVFLTYEGLPAVGTTDGIIQFLELQIAGKNLLSGSDFLRGMTDWPDN